MLIILKRRLKVQSQYGMTFRKQFQYKSRNGSFGFITLQPLIFKAEAEASIL